jgi:hypothetical protein
MKPGKTVVARSVLYTFSGGALSVVFALAGAHEAKAAPAPPPPPAPARNDSGAMHGNNEKIAKMRLNQRARAEEAKRRQAEARDVAGRGGEPGTRTVRRAVAEQRERDERKPRGLFGSGVLPVDEGPLDWLQPRLPDGRPRRDVLTVATVGTVPPVSAEKQREQSRRQAEARLRLSNPEVHGTRTEARVFADVRRVVGDAAQNISDDSHDPVKQVMAGSAAAAETPSAFHGQQVDADQNRTGQRPSADRLREGRFLRGMGGAWGVFTAWSGAMHDINEGDDPARAVTSSVLSTIAGAAASGAAAGALGGPAGAAAGVLVGTAAGLVTSGVTEAVWDYVTGAPPEQPR